jgi:vacuolar-type H+-ATPase subunit D/Vma8
MTVKEVLNYKLHAQKHFIALAFIQSELSIWVRSAGRPVIDRKCIEMAESFEALLNVEELEKQVSSLYEELRHARE